jgi:protein N-terminal amidase
MKPEENIERMKKSLDSFKKEENFDIIMMPEMAFTGYNFKSKEEIKPFLEKSGEGKTFEFLSS